MPSKEFKLVLYLLTELAGLMLASTKNTIKTSLPVPTVPWQYAAAPKRRKNTLTYPNLTLFRAVWVGKRMERP